jgi:citrate lyase beta subunit
VRDAFARSLLFVPANRAKHVESALRSEAEAIVFDLEDSVAVDQKAAAREAVRAILLERRTAGQALFVRVNGIDTPDFAADLRALQGTAYAGLVIPKIESVAAVTQVVTEAGAARLVLLLETPRGILRALDIAEAAGASLAALAFGAEDLCAAMGVDPAASEPPIAFARAAIAVAAAAVEVPAIDAPEMNVADHDRLRAQSSLARSAGFVAKFAIHPAQLAIIHDVFGPTTVSRAWAERVTRAYEEGVVHGLGSVRVDDRVVDTATIQRARRILEGKQS